MDISFQPMAVFTNSLDTDGRLVLVDGHLMAVLVRLEDEEHGPLRGAWFLETALGACATFGGGGTYFASLDEAADWARQQLSRIASEERPARRASGGR